MIDIKYYNMRKAIAENAAKISSYNDLRGINKIEDYESIWEDLIAKYNIDVIIYSEIRKYIVIVDGYFRDYDLNYLKRKANQYTTNMHH